MVEQSGEMSLIVDSQGFPDPQPGSGTNDEQHPIEARGKPDNPRNYFTREARRLLFLLVYHRHVDELVIPFPGVNLLPLFIDGRCDHRFHDLRVVSDRLRAKLARRDFALTGKSALEGPDWASRIVLFRLYYLGLAPYENARDFLGLSETTWVNWTEQIRHRCGKELLSRGMFPPRKYFVSVD